MGSRPTAWRSAAASALHQTPSKTSDLAREAVSCNAMLGGRAGLFRILITYNTLVTS
jgi:hypothetical protein